MATFYVLPPRNNLEEELSALLGRLLPGLPMPVDAWDAVTDRLASIAGWPADVYLVPRDDLPPGEPVHLALAEHFGAEPGDSIVEVRPAGSQFRVLSGMSASLAAR